MTGDGDDLGDKERSGVVGSFVTDLLAVLGVPRSILFGRVMLVVKMTWLRGHVAVRTLIL